MKNRFLKIFACAAIACMSAFVIAGCSGESESEEAVDGLQTDTGLTGGIAATVNGVEIEEDKVTRYINNFRIQGGYEDDESWKEYLTNYSYTPESIRDEVLDTFIDQELILQCAEQEGVTTTDEEIDSYVQTMRENYSSDEAWQTGLEGAGFESEDDYRDALRYSILNKKLEEGFEAAAEPDEATLLEQAQNSMATYDGSKRSSHILLKAEDKATAEDLLEMIKNGEMDFAEAAKEYSTDTGSAQEGGDVGWDRINTFVTEYQTALDSMNVGDISDLVESEYGYHIIKVTEEFNAPETLENTDQIPEGILEEIKSNYMETTTNTTKEDWLSNMRETNDVVVNDPPEGLPYWVDMDDTESEEEQAQINEEADQELADDVAATEEETTAIEGDAANTNGEGADASASSADSSAAASN